MKAQEHPVVILGLGVSGLGCSIALARRGAPFVALEREDRAGGLAKSDMVGGFPFDYGPHVLLQMPEEVKALLGELDGVRFNEYPGRSGIVLGTRMEEVVPAPFQLHLHQLPVATRARLALGEWRGRSATPANYAEYAAAQCGPGAYELFVRGYDLKRLRFPLEEIPPDWTTRMERTSLRSIFVPTNGQEHREQRFLYPAAGGIEALPQAMARLLPEACAHYGSEAVEIEPETQVARLANGEAVRYGQLVTSLPLPETVARIRNAPAEVRRAAANLLYTSVYVINAIVAGPLPPWSILRFPDPALGFYRLSFPSQYGAKGTQCAVTGEISHHPTRHPLSPQQAARQFHEGLKRLGILRGGERAVFESVRNIAYGHVLYNHGTQASRRMILDYLRAHGIHCCGKYGRWRDMLIPQSIVSGMEAARAVLNEPQRDSICGLFGGGQRGRRQGGCGSR